MSGVGWDRQEPPVFDLGELPAPLMDHPVVAVAEQDQVTEIGRSAMGLRPGVMAVDHRLSLNAL